VRTNQELIFLSEYYKLSIWSYDDRTVAEIVHLCNKGLINILMICYTCRREISPDAIHRACFFASQRNLYLRNFDDIQERLLLDHKYDLKFSKTYGIVKCLD